MPEDKDRSLTRIELADLLRLAELTAGAEAESFERNSGRYAGRLPSRALWQALALIDPSGPRRRSRVARRQPLWLTRANAASRSA